MTQDESQTKPQCQEDLLTTLQFCSRTTMAARARGARLLSLVLLSLVGCDSTPAHDLGEQATAAWTLATQPFVTIGEQDGDPKYLLERIVHGQLMANGRIVLVDFGARAIRVYAPSGEHIADLGGRGDGPGEFQRILASWIAEPDTIYGYDYRVPRVTWFAPDGTLGGTRRMDIARAPFFLGHFSNGDVVLGWVKNLQARDPTRIISDTIEFGRFARDGTRRANLGLGLGFRHYQYSTHQVSPGMHGAVYRDSLYYTDGLDHITVRDRDGRIARRIVLPLPALASAAKLPSV